MLNKEKLPLLKKSRSITIKKANIITMLVIFAFTIIFATLLIKEKYYEYQHTLDDKLTTIENQHKSEIISIATQVSNIIKYLGCQNRSKIIELLSKESVTIDIQKTTQADSINFHHNKNLLIYQLVDRGHLIVVTKDISSVLKLEEENRKKLKSVIIQSMVAIATLAFILFAIVLGFYNIFNSLLQRDIDIFLEFFSKSAHNEQVINPNAIFFDDFKSMVGHANAMIDIINSQKKSLRELNLSLEDKVRQKTANLQRAKDFSERILKNQKEFLRYTVHETNTPLSVILTSIEILDMKEQKSKELSKIEAATKNIFSIYDDLSYLVKKDQIEYPKKVINLEEFVSSRIDFFSLVAQMNHLRFEYHYPQNEKLFIYFNKTKLQRVVDNTITNAIKYTLPNETIEITLAIVGSQIELAIGSHSKEIEDTNRIFDAFYREEKSQEGFGIGLRLVKTICDEEDVMIAIDSNQAMNTFRYRFKMMGS